MKSRRRSAVPVLFAFLAAAAAAPAGAAQATEPRHLRVLFLGDRGHHQPALRAQQVLPVLRAQGIDLFYEESTAVLRPENLERYDALLIYANHPTCTAGEMDALLAFVEGGKGLVALHCASYCFLDQPRYLALIGGQFLSHGAGDLRERHLQPGHPILNGLAPLESWDESYVHHRLSGDRTVLAVRDEGASSEPWTWVREQGRGRVFYSAWGHDQRTWSRPGFHDLLARAIRWSCGDPEPAAAPPSRPFEYDAAQVPIYGASGPATTALPVQRPLAPAASQARLVAPPGFEVRLYAAEPEVAKPIALAFDERGRPWVAETVDYPNDRVEGGPGRDRIRILEDGDGDERADRFLSYTEGLSIPTGLCFANGGLIVAQAPHVLFFRDHDGDDRADERRVLFSGFGTFDTHAGPSHLRYGFDGWIWGTVGYAGFQGTVGGERHAFGQGIFRFRPDGTRLEFVAPTTNNTWGLGFSEDALVFASTANGNPSVHPVIANRYYEAVAGASPRALPTIAESLRIHPVVAQVRQVDYHGLFTAAAGHTVYTAREFPPEYWNRAAFVCEPTGHLIHRFFLEPDGASFRARDGWSLVASDDEWTSPVACEVGPDGALWFLDWYSYVVQHNPTPPGYATGAGNAYVTPLRDKAHGRIYRVVPEGWRPKPWPELSPAAPDALLAALDHDNLGWRLTAQRLLVESAGEDVTGLLLRRLQRGVDGSSEFEPGLLHALYALHSLGELEDGGGTAAAFAEELLRHPAATLRRTAAELLPPTARTQQALWDAGLLFDKDTKVQIAALLALSETPPSQEMGRRLWAWLEEAVAGGGMGGGDLDDRWLADAVLCAAARHASGFLPEMLASPRAAPVAVPAATAASESNLLPNPGFEETEAGRPVSWRVRRYSGTAEHHRASSGRSGGHALEIRSAGGADTSWYARAELDPDARYRLSGWIKTEGVEVEGGLGALLNVHEIQGAVTARTEPVLGTADWTRVEVVFEAQGRSEVTINCLFGGWGRAAGAAWYDDLALERLPDAGLPGPLGRIVYSAMRHYSRSASPGELAALFRAAPPASELRGQLAQFLVAEGREDLLAAVLPEALAEARAQLLDAEASSAARAAAARRLVGLDDGTATAEALLGLLSPQVDAELAAGVLDALGESRVSATGPLLIRRLEELPPAAQGQAVRVLLRRESWTEALLQAVEEREVAPGLVDAATWQELAQHPKEELAAFARRVRDGVLPRSEVDLAEVARAVAGQSGDRGRGAELFRVNCLQCHAAGGEGGGVGPALDGIGARPRDELLASILEPSRDVEANYVLWIVRTRDGGFYPGRIVAESRTSIEILDSAGKARVLERGEIESITPSTLSLMPAGYELLGAQALADLLEFLRPIE